MHIMYLMCLTWTARRHGNEFPAWVSLGRREAGGDRYCATPLLAVLHSWKYRNCVFDALQAVVSRLESEHAAACERLAAAARDKEASLAAAHAEQIKEARR